MMGQHEDRRLEGRTRAGQPVGHAPFDISGEHGQSSAVPGQAQHQGAVVAGRIIVRARMQDVEGQVVAEVQPVPCGQGGPGYAAFGQGRLDGRGQGAFREAAVVVIGRDRKALEQGDQPLDVITVGVAGEHRLQARRMVVGQGGADHGPAYVEIAEQTAAVHEQALAAGQGHGHGLALAHVEHGEADRLAAVGQIAPQARTDEQGQAREQGGQGFGASGQHQGEAREQAVAAEQLRPGRPQHGRGEEQSVAFEPCQAVHELLATPSGREEQPGPGSGEQRHREQGQADQGHGRDHEAEQRQPGGVDPGIAVPVAKESDNDRQHGGFGAQARPQPGQNRHHNPSEKSRPGEPGAKRSEGWPQQSDAGHGRGRKLQPHVVGGQGRDRQHGGQGQKQAVAQRRVAAEKKKQTAAGEHEHGPVQRRRIPPQPAIAGHQRRGHEQNEIGARRSQENRRMPPARDPDQGDGHGHHIGHVHAGERQGMGQGGLAYQVEIRCGKAGELAEEQGRDHGPAGPCRGIGFGRRGQNRKHPVADAFPPPVGHVRSRFQAAQVPGFRASGVGPEKYPSRRRRNAKSVTPGLAKPRVGRIFEVKARRSPGRGRNAGVSMVRASRPVGQRRRSPGP